MSSIVSYPASVIAVLAFLFCWSDTYSTDIVSWNSFCGSTDCLTDSGSFWLQCCHAPHLLLSWVDDIVFSYYLSVFSVYPCLPDFVLWMWRPIMEATLFSPDFFWCFLIFYHLARIFSRHLLSKVFVLTFLQFPWIYVSGWTSWFFPCSSIFLRCLSVFITLCKKKENSVANQAGFYLKTFFLSGAIFTKFAMC